MTAAGQQYLQLMRRSNQPVEGLVLSPEETRHQLVSLLVEAIYHTGIPAYPSFEQDAINGAIRAIRAIAEA
jgi:hypothetical protein